MLSPGQYRDDDAQVVVGSVRGGVDAQEPDAGCLVRDRVDPSGGPGVRGGPARGRIVVRVARGVVSIGQVPLRDPDLPRGRRGRVDGLSDGSRSRLGRWLRECRADYRVLLTLTVRDWEASERCGRDFKVALDRMLVWLMRRITRPGGWFFPPNSQNPECVHPEDAGLTWFLEFQGRGAPHVHILLTSPVPRGTVAGQWAKIASDAGFGDFEALQSASTRIEWLRGGSNKASRYALKYAGKLAQKDVPHGYWSGRMWGIRGDRRRGSCHVQLSAAGAGAAHLHDLAGLLRAAVADGKLRRLAWKEGAGAVYFEREAGALSGEMLADIHLKLQRAVLEGGGRLVKNWG